MFRSKSASAIHLNKKNDVKSFIENYKKLIKNNKITLKSQQTFKSKRQKVFTKEINKIALSSNDDKEYNQLI